MRSFSIVAIAAVLFSLIACPAFAEGINYRDYEGNVTVDGDNDIVTVNLPAYWFTGLIAMPDGAGLQPWNGHNFSCTIGADTNKLNIYLAPFGTEIGAYDRNYTGRYLSMDNIPSDAEFYLQFGVTTSSPDSFTISRIQERVYSVNDSYASMYSMNTYPGGEPGSFAVSTVFDAVDAQGWFPEYIMYLQSGGTTFAGTTISFEVYSFRLEVSISSLYRLQEQSGITNDLLTEVNRQLEEQGKTMEDILDQQQQTNDKLDKLPGEIGDEMQGIIDNEKAESESEGNKFVDQILDALPDPSTDVLAAMKSLTDSTAYTGTDAVLPIPAIVLPGIDGLFPETEIWGGAEFDFCEYIGLLPPTLLTLVQSLFTIAIILYCVYELKGIISYCLTLKDSKGG